MDTSRTHPHPHRTATLTALALFALAACGTESGSDAGGDGTVKPDLQVAGVDWTVDSVTVDGKKLAAPKGTTVRIDEDGDNGKGNGKARASGNSGCNQFGADVDVTGDTITVGPGQTTEMACAKDIQKFEENLQRTFRGALKAKVTDDKLTLTTTKGDTIALTAEKPDAAAPLVGTKWRVESLLDGDTATSLPKDVAGKANLVFGKDGSVGGNLGCNNVTGQAKVSGSTLTFSKIATTRKMCPPKIMETERALLKILDGEVKYELRDRTLTLTAEDGNGLDARAK
ncbi:META domain-containing protein [Streptomyces sp. ISL-98]|uniref:META domain-containing protein n=1 Tax=Streptomyces sp. ISL-98 TaxID=2819192 RepID=UPI001BEA72DA|nr:META domain-containing protein [Streptomyces sp. ISL-98]MBT2507347.1 META domain-containing protein [Streptomyces sp. ISL-98]